MVDIDKSLKRKWDHGVDWNNLLPPSRPSIYHLKVIRKELEAKDNNLPVAVLGSTPEFRDLLAGLGFKKVFVFDKSLLFHERANKLRCYSNEETLIQGDWLQTISTFPKTFVAILSDLTSGNVPYDKQENFYRDISSALISNGSFIDKVLTNEAEFSVLDDLDEKYKSMPYNLETLNFFSCEYFFGSELVKQFKLTDVSKFYEILDKRFTHPVLRKFLQNTLSITPKNGIWYYGDSWLNFKKRYFRYLTLARSYPEPIGNPYHKRMRTLVTNRKEKVNTQPTGGINGDKE